MKNGDNVKIYGADNRWHKARYVGEISDGRHVVEMSGRTFEGAFVEPDMEVQTESVNYTLN